MDVTSKYCQKNWWKPCNGDELWFWKVDKDILHFINEYFNLFVCADMMRQGAIVRSCPDLMKPFVIKFWIGQWKIT